MAAGQSAIAAEDFSALPAYHIYAALLRGNSLQPWASGVTLPAPEACSDPADIRARSRARYGQPLMDIEADFAALLDQELADRTSEIATATGRRRRTTP
jgi:hypothetical protein